MTLTKSMLLGAAAVLTTVGVASAADLPSRKSAPVEYVKVCNASGAGFFYIPGTDTCLKIGATVLFEARYIPAALHTYKWTPAVGGVGAGVVNANRYNRDSTGSAARARVDFDSRTATSYGTLRAYAQLEAYYGTALASTGALKSAGPASATDASAARETTIVSKAFIQFAGITAGRAQSMFDFYAGAYNWENLRGSNATTNLLAYTATFGGGFSATLSIEDETARRSMVGSVDSDAGQFLKVDVGGTRMPDIVANLRVDQGWGSAQLSGALHNARVSTVDGNMGPHDEKLGWAIQGGVKINLPMLAAGDALYLEAVYQKGAHSYMNGNNLTASEGVTANKHYGRGAGNLPSSPGLNLSDFDCVLVNGGCSQQKGFALTAAFKHNWTPTISQSIYGSYMKTEYSGAVLASGIAADWTDARVGSNVVWSPVKGFTIGAEVMYAKKDMKATNASLNAFLNNHDIKKTDVVETRVRVQRQF